MIPPDSKLMYRAAHSINDPVIKDILEQAVLERGGWHSQPKNQGVIDGMLAFFHAIDWKNNQSFFIVILLFHLSLLIGVILYRRSPNIQFCCLSLMLLAVLSTQYINQWASQYFNQSINQSINQSNNQIFSLTENYFDSDGIFISFFWSVPFSLIGLINCFCILYHTSNLMIIVKRKQLALQREKQSINQSNNQSIDQSNKQSNKQSVRRRNAEANKNHNKFILD